MASLRRTSRHSRLALPPSTPSKLDARPTASPSPPSPPSPPRLAVPRIHPALGLGSDRVPGVLARIRDNQLLPARVYEPTTRNAQN